MNSSSKNNEVNQQIYKAALQFRDAVKYLGGSNVTIMYVFTQEDGEDGGCLSAGYKSDSPIHALGAAKYISDFIVERVRGNGTQFNLF